MGREIRLIEIIELEEQAESSGAWLDAMLVWTVHFYHQRTFWYDIFVGFTYAFEILFSLKSLETFPAPSYTKEYFDLRRYLRRYAGFPPLEKMFLISHRSCVKYRISRQLSFGKVNHLLARVNPLHRAPATLQETEHFFTQLKIPKLELTPNSRQSKLSQEQLTELQRSTHFDKKELQQWYKGK